jgi:hypothetical protein
MKAVLLSLLAAALCGLFSACQTTPEKPVANAPKIVVNFTKPEDFTDFKDGFATSPKGIEHYEDIFTTAIQHRAAKLIPPGSTLEITFTDIDLAGDYLPSMPMGRDIRVIKSLYFPRSDLRFVLKDADGKVLKEGERHLKDMDFLYRVGINRGDELYYDTKLLDDWLDSEFAP